MIETEVMVLNWGTRETTWPKINTLIKTVRSSFKQLATLQEMTCPSPEETSQIQIKTQPITMIIKIRKQPTNILALSIKNNPIIHWHNKSLSIKMKQILV